MEDMIPGQCDFNPRSREGSDRPPEPTDRNRQISIHAPTRGATSAVLLSPVDTSNFNPRSREGSDEILPSEKAKAYNFNPCSRERSDSN